MAIFPIRTYPDPVLRMGARPVTTVDDEVRHLIADMIETMYAAPGVGLAAPQIGIGLRVIVFDAGDGPHTLVNPVLEKTSGSWVYEEGCLSVPDRYWQIKRPAFARASGWDSDGRPVTFEGDELMGRVLQHEIDHVGGKLLLSRLTRRDRAEALRQLREESLEAQDRS
jgi:peptide deformylase